MTRMRLTIAMLGLLPFSGTLGACNTFAGFGRDITAAAEWTKRQLGGGSTATAGGAAPAATGTSTGSGTGAAPADRMTEAQARSYLQDRGYSNVSDLHVSGNDWAASAVDGSGRPVHVVVGRDGVTVTVP